MSRSRLLLSFVLLSMVASFSVAQVRRPRPVTDDPAIEQRLQKLSHELRCLVCQNETLADSRADLAEDLRDEIRQQMKAGKTDKEIIAFLTDRYGQFILYRPQVTILFFYIKQRRDAIAEQPLSADERRRAEDLLRTSSGKETA